MGNVGTKFNPRTQQVFTTGQIAHLCKVSPRMVSKWVDTGRLRGYRIPGGQDRRIPRANLVRFLREHGMPLGLLGQHGCRVLLVGCEPALAVCLERLLPATEGYLYATAPTGFAAAQEALSFIPNVVVLDLALGRSEGLAIAAALREGRPDIETLALVALANEDETNELQVLAAGFTDMLRKPYDVALLTERIRRAAEEMGL